jgi:UDP-N-acetylglucosamine 4,6-dehydratase
MDSILITGITGFLGTRIAKACIDRGLSVVGVAHSEIRDKKFKTLFPEVSTYCADISHDTDILDHIIKTHNVDYIIHTAAMKHIGVCESNPNKAIDVNIFGSKKVVSAAINNNIKNVIAISTDKSINPSCVYGFTKFLMEKLVMERGYSVFQGVNFFFSTGSVLDIWDSCRMKGEPLTVNPINTVRYFVSAEDVADKILNNLDRNGETLYLETCYKVGLHELYEAYADYHDYYNRECYDSISAEKTVEEIPEGVTVIDSTPEILKEKFDKYYA